MPGVPDINYLRLDVMQNVRSSSSARNFISGFFESGSDSRRSAEMEIAFEPAVNAGSRFRSLESVVAR